MRQSHPRRTPPDESSRNRRAPILCSNRDLAQVASASCRRPRPEPWRPTFAQLGALPRERRHETELPLGGVERTLEEIVREMLRPLLQAWLDSHLPGIVERLVREEIARVVGEAGLR